ncbi:MAG: nucleotidyl transferase AbiEii/AbiGii toxin family protein, partial [Pseudomonadota bacterium]
MNNVFTPKFDILPLAQQSIWHELNHAKSIGYVLYGGTAIALRLGHRISIDYDFFTEKPLDLKMLKENFLFLNKA